MRGKSFGLIIIFFVLSLLAGCSKRPKGVLSEDKMVNLLVDMEIAEAYVNTQMSASSDEKIKIGKQVLALHGVTEESLDTTLAWYGRNMDEYSELFEKVDKEIEKRREKYTDVPGQKPRASDNLWPYSEHLIISPLSGQEVYTFTLMSPETNKGDIIKMSFSLPNNTTLKGTLGVEYNDGYGEANIVNYSSKKNVEFALQTDSSKKVSKIFGILDVKDIKNPVYLDSIKIETEPIDSLSYRSKRRTQKSFGIMRSQKIEVKKIEKDSVETAKDSLNIAGEDLKNTLKDPAEEKTTGLTLPGKKRPLSTKPKRAVQNNGDNKFDKLQKNS